MQESDITTSRVLSVYWLLLWRSLLGQVIFGAIAGGIAGLAVGIAGHPDYGRTAGFYAGAAITPF